MTGDQNHGQLCIHDAYIGQQLQTAFARQADIADHHTRKFSGKMLERQLGTADAAALEAFEPQRLLACHGDIGIIFNDQNMEG